MTLDSLPQADRDQFAAWKAQIVKDCAWEQAFPSLSSEFPDPSGQPYTAASYVDLDALHAAHDGPVLAANGQVVMLGAAPLDDSFYQDDRAVHTTVNGRRRALDVRADRENGICVINLGGEEIFRGALPKTVPVIASYDPSAPAPAPVDLPPFLVATSPGTPVAGFSGDALIQPVRAALVPSDRAYAMIAAQLAISGEQARALFSIAGAVSPAAGRVITPSGITPFGATAFASFSGAYGSEASVESLYAAGAVEIELLYPGLDRKIVALRAQLSVAAGGKSVAVTSITRADLVSYDDDAARHCFLDRDVGKRFETNQPRSPEFDNQFAGCGALTTDGYAALAADPVTRQMVATKAIGPGVTPGNYRGWDSALIKLAVAMDGRGVALSELDPSGTLADLPAILGRVTALRRGLTDPAHQTEVAGGVIELAFGWYFQGKVPTDGLVNSITAALSNAAADYPASAAAMLLALVPDLGPNSPGARAAQCGAGITGDRRAQLAQTLSAVDQVPFASGFAADQRGTILQTCPTADDLSQIAASAAAAGTFITADQARAGSSLGFADDAAQMIEHALTERWTSDSFRALGDLLGFSVIATGHTFCSGYSSWSERATCIDPSLALFSTGSAGILAPGVAARYAAMARELTQRWPALDRLGHISVEISITGAWDAGLWRTCSDTGFASDKQQLYALLDMLPGATISQLGVIEDQIDTLLEPLSCR